jgi:hypothetical protein
MRGEPGPGRAVHRGLTAARTEGAGARWRAHRCMASGHPGGRKLTDGAQQGSMESTARASPELGRRCGDRATVGEIAEEEELVDSGAHATGEGKSAMGRCGESRGLIALL